MRVGGQMYDIIEKTDATIASKHPKQENIVYMSGEKMIPNYQSYKQDTSILSSLKDPYELCVFFLLAAR
jgi:hypothetical protein